MKTATQNIATPEGKELGAHLSRFCDGTLSGKRDNRCETCAFKSGNHLANGSLETLMTALKCVMERTPFYCHEHDRPCAGYVALKFDKETTINAPWESIEGFD